ncbi:MAG: EAL domain-containing protein [Ectothiorhodospiraceae bacterium]|nr:EAL domain-containing protein [Ectothiorhodospiraceae bacterium]
MSNSRSSMRASLGLIVLIMGILGMALAFTTGEAFRQLALDNQREAFVNLAKLNFENLLEHLEKEVVQIGLDIQQPAKFKQAMFARDTDKLSRQMNEHFKRGPVTLGTVKLLKIYALNIQYQLIVASSQLKNEIPMNSLGCTKMLNDISKRRGAERLKPKTSRCLVGTRSVLATIVPVGGLKIQGYLLLLVDPVPTLSQSEEGLGTPVRIINAAGNEVFKSSTWPTLLSTNIMMTHHTMIASENDIFLEFNFATNISHLQGQLSETRNLLFTIAAIVMLSTGLLALLIFQRTALIPLSTLSEHLKRVQKDKSQLGKKVKAQGNTEIVALANEFNNMSGELNTLYHTLENMAFTDDLTGMSNRTLFYERLEQITLLSSRSNTEYAILMMDLDRFKNINDTLGHHVGDQMLKIVGQRLQSIIRKSDTVARLGGDEFAVLLPIVEHSEGAVNVAEKIIDCLNKPIIAENHSLSIGISIGIVKYPHDGTDATLLMRHADVAMYHAKREGIGYAFYKQSMGSENLYEFTMESELRQAIEASNFTLNYQPKIDIKQKCISGVEALIRWTHEEHGFIPPDKFIPLAEQTGLIKPLTQWVLKTALNQCAEWHKKKILIGVSVNLSAYSLNDIDLLDTVRQALAKAKLDPHWLTLELTETGIMSNPDRALSTLSQLNSMGITLSIDDFGTGYSSLAYLKRLPVNELKIDKSFVMDMIEDTSDAVIVRSTIDLAHNMGMTVVAEGIESQEVWDQLAKLGCNQGQGYLMCRPCLAEDLEKWLTNSKWANCNLKRTG